MTTHAPLFGPLFGSAARAVWLVEPFPASLGPLDRLLIGSAAPSGFESPRRSFAAVSCAYRGL